MNRYLAKRPQLASGGESFDATSHFRALSSDPPIAGFPREFIPA